MAIFSLITASLAGAGFTGAISIFGLSPAVSAVVLSIGRSALYSAGLAALQSRPTLPKQRYQAQIQEAVQARVKGYGRVRLGGQRVFFEALDGGLHVVTVHHSGEIHELEGFMVDTHDVELDANGITENGDFDFGNRIQLAWRNGAVADYADLRAEFPTVWTDDHQLLGLTHSYMRISKPSLDKLSQQIPSGENTALSIKANATPVLDPRTGLVGPSENPSLAILDYLPGQQGMRIPASFIYEQSFADFADVCDVQYALASGGFQNRYVLGGAYALTDDPRDVLPRMLATCDGFLYMTTEGQIAISGGQYSEPDFTLSSDDILSIEWERGQDPLTDFNVLKGVYTSPGHDFKDQQAPEIRDEASLAERGEQIQAHEVLWCTDGVQMQRLMKSHKELALPDIRATITTNLVGMKARFPKGDGMHTIRIDHPRMGGVYLVTNHDYDIPSRRCVLQVQSINDAWQWSFDEEQPLSLTLDELAEADALSRIPVDLQVTQAQVQVGVRPIPFTNLEEPIFATELRARVRDPERDDLRLVLEYANLDLASGTFGGALNYTRIDAAENTYEATAQPTPGANYRVRVSFAGIDVAEADLPFQEILIVSNPAQPDQPTGFTASKSGVTINLAWTNPPADHDKTWVYRSSTASYGVAEFIAELPSADTTYSEAPGLGEWFYWIVPVSADNAAPDPLGPVTEIIS